MEIYRKYRNQEKYFIVVVVKSFRRRGYQQHFGRFRVYVELDGKRIWRIIEMVLHANSDSRALYQSLDAFEDL